MKAVLPLLLVILLLLNLFGFYIAYDAKLEMVHEEMEQTLLSSPANLQVISLSIAEYRQLEWTKPGRECRIHGIMYDVAKTEATTSSVRLYVRMDEDETKLDNDFLQNFQSGQDSPRTPVRLLISTIGQDFIVAKSKIIPSPVFARSIFQSHIFKDAITEFIMEKISPPPWC